MLEYIITVVLLFAGSVLFVKYVHESRNRKRAESGENREKEEANMHDPCAGCGFMCDTRSNIHNKQGGSK